MDMNIKTSTYRRVFAFGLFVLSCVLLVPLKSMGADITPLQSFLAARSEINSTLPSNAIWSFSVMSPETGKRHDAGNANEKALVPASVVKLLVTAAMLESDARRSISLDTVLYSDGEIHDGVLQGTLYIKGYGNALLSEQDLASAVDALLEQGLHTVEKGLVADESYFDAGTWKVSWRGPAYAPPGALGLDLHTVSVGEHVSPLNSYVRIILSGPGKEVTKLGDMYYRIPPGAKRKRFALDDPALFAAYTLRSLLNKSGINVKGETAKGLVPEGATELYRIPSKPLKGMVRDVNVHSLNVMAENLLLALSAHEYGAPGTYEKGRKAVSAFLARLGLSDDFVKIIDGSGLSEDNTLRSDGMTSFLGRIARESWFRSFYESLPRSGIDGTLKGYEFKSEHARAKSGQTDRVFALAGYVTHSSGEKTAFTLVVNVPGAGMLPQLGSRVLEILSGENLAAE